MRQLAFGSVLLVAIGGGCNQSTEKQSATGPNGGDLVSIKDGSAYSEVLANADTGEVMVHTWDKDLKTRRPIERQPITVGSGENSVELTPHPMDADPSGTCSRFYGQASWVRGGGVHNGWMHGGGTGDHRTFDWIHCWKGGEAHGQMWEEMGKHRNMGPGQGAGHHGGKMDR